MIILLNLLAEHVKLKDASDLSKLCSKQTQFFELAQDITADFIIPCTFAGTLNGKGRKLSTRHQLFKSIENATIYNISIDSQSAIFSSSVINTVFLDVSLTVLKLTLNATSNVYMNMNATIYDSFSDNSSHEVFQNANLKI